MAYQRTEENHRRLLAALGEMDAHVRRSEDFLIPLPTDDPGLLEERDLLRDATFGIFDKWKDDNKHQFSKAAGNIIAEALGTYQKAERKGKRLEVRLDSETDRREVIRLLKAADPSDPALVRHYAQLPLFDN